ncbi:MAG: PrsW family intramembrane metalloprotease [Anaerolineales bacterium]|nr:PrsW family intramembrane metalloprotease [Anaerolineales bacterium]
MGMILGLILAFTIPLVFLVIVYKLDFYQTGQFRFILLSFGWGLTAYYLAVIANRSLTDFSGFTDWDTVVRFYAPPLEEIFKGLFLLYLVRRPQFTYSVDGAIYGFAAGIGFAVIENYEYVTADSTIAITVAVQRVFSTNLIHASGSAIIGIALGMFRLKFSRFPWMILLSGVLLAIGQHMLFNNIISNGTLLIVAIGAGAIGAGFIFLGMQWGRRQARGWIKEKLGMADRVTTGEARIVNRLEDLDEILQPVYQRFGPEKTDLVEKFLRMQARLGIKRKTLDTLDSKLRTAVEAEMKTMAAEMDKIRRDLGAYVMMFVRSVYSEEVISLWNQLHSKVEQQSEATGGQKGGGLWSTLGNRISKSSTPEGIE